MALTTYCPYCNQPHHNVDELGRGTHHIECQKCENEFEIRIEVRMEVESFKKTPAGGVPP